MQQHFALQQSSAREQNCLRPEQVAMLSALARVRLRLRSGLALPLGAMLGLLEMGAATVGVRSIMSRARRG